MGAIVDFFGNLFGGGKSDERQPQVQQNLGNLTDAEAKESASKKAFRQGLFLTSPTGLQSGTRGRSRLMGM